MMMVATSRNVLQHSYIVKENTASAVKARDINSIIIKERTGNNQAKVVLKGQEVTAQFEREIPAGDRVLVEVTQQNENGNIVIKPVLTQPQGELIQSDELMKNTGFEPNGFPELKAAVSQILSRGGNISKDAVVVLKDFLENEQGTATEKLNTIKIMQQKNIEFTKTQLHSVHTALNGEPLIETLSKLLDGPIQIQAKITLKEQIQRVRETVQKEPQLDKAIDIIKEKLLNSQELQPDVKKILQKGINEANRFASTGNLAVGKGIIVEALVTAEKLVENTNTVQKPTAQETNVPALIVPQAEIEQNITDINSVPMTPETAAAKSSLSDTVENEPTKTNADSRSAELSNLVKKTLSTINSAKGLKAQPNFFRKTSASVQEDDEPQIKSEPSKSTEEILTLLDPEKDQQAISDIKKSVQIFQAGKQRMVQAIEYSPLPNAVKENVRQQSDLSKIMNTLKQTDLPTDAKDKVVQATQEAAKLESIGVNRLEAALKSLLKNEANIQPANSEGESITSDVAEEEKADSLNIKAVAKLIQKEPSMAKVLEGVQSLLESSEGQTELNNAFEKAAQLTNQGRELAARKELATAINSIEEKHYQLQKTEPTLPEMEQSIINEAVQSMQFDSKNILLTQITKQLSQLAIDFKIAKREMSRNLDSASRLLEGNKPGSVLPAKQMIDSAVKELNHVLLKSDVMLYTDMDTEKSLLAASSKLTAAKNLLSKGNLAEANKIVKDIKGTLDKLIFKPSKTKIMHITKTDDVQSPKSMLENAIRPSAGRGRSPRQLFETIKGLGLTHEKDATQALVDKKEIPHNLKEILLKMAETADSRTRPSVDQALANITGQQLLNKQDSSSMQNLFFQLPILLNQQAENVKIYVNSQKQGEKIDWENCNLYFVLETKKLGEVGIMVSAVNRNLSITFKNDREELSKAFTPLTEVTKERLQDIGYNVGAIQVKPLNGGAAAESSQPLPTPAFTEKGYDFSI